MIKCTLVHQLYSQCCKIYALDDYVMVLCIYCSETHTTGTWFSDFESWSVVECKNVDSQHLINKHKPPSVC